MKPLLSLLSTAARPSLLTPLTSSLTIKSALPSLTRSASILGSLSDVPSAYNKRIRRGRGPSSGKGKTSGRGHKGQGQHGKVPFGFNGGQTKDIVVSGPRGFTNKFSKEYATLNLDRLQSWIRQGRLDTTKVIGITELLKSGCVTDVKDGIKLLSEGREQWTEKIEIVVSRASQKAIEAVERTGGKITARFYNKSGLEHMANPSKDPEHRLADPTSRKDREFYRDPANRGYLAGTLKEGERANLYFKNREIGVDSAEEKAKKVDTSSNRLF